MSGDDIVERLRQVHQTVPIPSIASLYSNAADEIVRLRAEREAIEALHQPQEALDEYLRPEQWCPACANYWPCPTYLLLHPEEARHA